MSLLSDVAAAACVVAVIATPTGTAAAWTAQYRMGWRARRGCGRSVPVSVATGAVVGPVGSSHHVRFSFSRDHRRPKTIGQGSWAGSRTVGSIGATSRDLRRTQSSRRRTSLKEATHRVSQHGVGRAACAMRREPPPAAWRVGVLRDRSACATPENASARPSAGPIADPGVCGKVSGSERHCQRSPVRRPPAG